MIGVGGMGQVYQARDTRLGRTVAIKILPPELADDPQRRARFEREAKAISGLNHPHICTLHDVGEHPSTGSGQATLYLVMEYLTGETLAARLDQGGSRWTGCSHLPRRLPTPWPPRTAKVWCIAI